ncbi:hypothetical protein OESDEN_00408 [Oesophagostomum dentatum]|uniref:Uncharacterized protein n=1 Tax=Oesophagostomum dentatum TaxID=61180 RepID=A0A0B1TQN9_OESDE|nr:hypothetical protein OESDEN_00408 [Oesophagostomum dentatum]
MSAEFKKETVDHIVERLHDTEIFKFIQSLIRESVLRIIRPEAVIRVTQLSDEELIYHSMIHHFLTNNGYKAAAEVMQAECYEKFLGPEVLKQTVETYDSNSVKRCLAKLQIKAGAGLKKELTHTEELNPRTKLIPKPDREFEKTREALRTSVMEFAEESVKKKDELKQKEEAISEEEVDGEDEEEEVSDESKSSASSTTAESEPEAINASWTKRLWGPSAHQLSTDTIVATPQPSRPSQLPPLASTRPKPQLTSIKSMDFDIPQLEKSPSAQSIETPRASPSLFQAVGSSNKEEEGETKKSAEEVEELSEIESLTGIDQLLESDRSGSISF